jgi:hypothetical protein
MRKATARTLRKAAMEQTISSLVDITTTDFIAT